MDLTNNERLKHDFHNSITTINNLAIVLESFVKKFSPNKNNDQSLSTQKQIELFRKSMELIRKETKKIELIFNKILV